MAILALLAGVIAAAAALIMLIKPEDILTPAWIGCSVAAAATWGSGLNNIESLDADGVKKVRARMEALFTKPTNLTVDKIYDMTVPSGDGYNVPVRVYHPNATAQELGQPLMVTVFLHGGGWAVGSVPSYDPLTRALALETNGVVVSVDYRLSPEHPFPTPFDDSLAAAQWVLSNAAGLGADPRRVAVAGDSAGGNLAAAVALALAGDDESSATASPLCAAVLASPVLSHQACAEPTGSYARFARGYLLSRHLMNAYWNLYLGGLKPDPERVAVTGRDWRASPLEAPAWRLRALPPTLIPLASAEVLVDEIERFAAAARTAAAPEVTLRVYEGTVHAFFGHDQLPYGAESLSHAAEFLRERCA
ncbi:Alpha/Beta hydrolase protein [Tribonema minus]|uniref:Alpha/Beta hydrolase protein n=1 Tax=Tribonema minus TaxID=303371 RepID=A0A835Z8T1_9STRA|nr:Alpha/Beta hydrolase protein [Tribonema minus]